MNKQSIDLARTWFTREQGIVKGPFPSGMIRRFVLLGRLTAGSEVSPDGRSWHSLGEISRLTPKERRSRQKDLARAFGEVVRGWDDERNGERRKDAEAMAHAGRRKGDRRRPELAAMVALRKLRQRSAGSVKKQPSRLAPCLWLAALLVPLCAAGIYQALTLTADIPAQQDCTAAPAAAVDWTRCNRKGAHLPDVELSRARMADADLEGALLRNARLGGADLSYANLQAVDLAGANLAGTVLVGADLRAANLTGAHLAQANLSFADLRGARIDGARLAGAKFDGALWLDGVTCGPESTGACRR
ncbi:MAG: pentapeptide repeat-containing protein [Porticoccaceae bacterium]